MRGELRRGEPLSAHTTFRIGGPCDAFAVPAGAADLATALSFLRSRDIKTVVIGQGSNVLFGDGGYRGCVVHIGHEMSKITFDGDVLEVEAGALLGKVVVEAAARGLGGLESLAEIPRSTGGALYMNAGAFGQWIYGPLESVDIIDEKGTRRRLDKSEIELRYRWSMFQARPEWTIVSARFRFERAAAAALKARVDEINKRRRATQPLGCPSAGSFFKNPEGCLLYTSDAADVYSV